MKADRFGSFSAFPQNILQKKGAKTPPSPLRCNNNVHNPYFLGGPTDRDSTNRRAVESHHRELPLGKSRVVIVFLRSELHFQKSLPLTCIPSRQAKLFFTGLGIKSGKKV